MRRDHKKAIFIKLEQRLLRSDAFRALRRASQMAVIWMELNYWEGERRNPIEISQQALAEWIGCCVKTAQSVLTELDDNGFLYRERAGDRPHLTGPD